MPKASEDNQINPQAFAKAVSNFKIGNYLQDYPRPALSEQKTSVAMNFSQPDFNIEKQEKSKPIPFSFILPITNSFMNSDGKVFTEPSIGFGVSTPVPEKYIGIKDVGVFGIVSNNLDNTSTAVAGAGKIFLKPTYGDFQANLGASAVMVCVERGNREKISPNPSIGTCGLFGSIYSSIVHLPSGIGAQAIVTPAVSDNQDTVFTLGAFKRF